MILRPGLVLAPTVYGGTAMLRGLAGLPFVTPVLEPEARVQVVSVDDVATTVSHSLTPEAKLRVKWDVAHPRRADAGDRGALRSATGSAFRRRPVWRVPHGLGTAVSAVADAARLSRLAQPRALDRGARSLRRAWSASPAPWIAATGIEPKSFEDDPGAAARERGRPLVRAAVSVQAARRSAGSRCSGSLTGMITLGPGRAAAMGHLAAAGFSPRVAGPVLLLGALFDYFARACAAGAAAAR